MKKNISKLADAYLLRLPPGLRDQVATMAAKNGRSMNMEIVEAIKAQLKKDDRMTILWDDYCRRGK